MDHRDITRLRDRARFARQHSEKALTTPDELDALLDLALAQIEEEQS